MKAVAGMRIASDKVNRDLAQVALIEASLKSKKWDTTAMQAFLQAEVNRVVKEKDDLHRGPPQGSLGNLRKPWIFEYFSEFLGWSIWAHIWAHKGPYMGPYGPQPGSGLQRRMNSVLNGSSSSSRMPSR